MNDTTAAIDAAWAQSLTDERLAADLDKLSEDIRYHGREARAALLREAALRLGNRP
jgi:hypothetical protein